MGELIAGAREPDLLRISESISEKVQAYVPGASVRLSDEIAGAGLPKPKVVARVREGRGISPRSLARATASSGPSSSPSCRP